MNHASRDLGSHLVDTTYVWKEFIFPIPGRSSMMTYTLYTLAALTEIAGCFSFWAWLRLSKPVWWLAPGMVSLALFAWLLALVPSEAAGRTFAAYGGIYIVTSLFWLWLVEGRTPDRWDMSGAAVCLAGTAIILFGPRG